ncbi:hypothetical protein DNAM5_137 [Haloarcula californiae tailed virus 1]|uniref:Uncharacterized protein n=1 Tax=Haloarcula californiae tailed virus 1 TaxID=1273746 RepID=R4TAM4_9CAUD|nr:hypothetical protein M202_gp083 [Haloarcula californiae tailed virus 1]AGM11995.1 hypothetical protein DNAM5_137 [Haloarcula californiae tailed virus 1]
MTTSRLRSFVSRLSASLRRSKPCGCAYPACVAEGVIPEARRVNDEVRNDGEYVIEYECAECGERFEVEEGKLLG